MSSFNATTVNTVLAIGNDNDQSQLYRSAIRFPDRTHAYRNVPPGGHTDAHYPKTLDGASSLPYIAS